MCNPKRKQKLQQYNKKREKQIEQNGGLRHTVGEWKLLCKLVNYTCIKCNNIPVKLSKDHIIPLSKGGTDHITNIQPLCCLCNSLKNDDEIDYRSQQLIQLVTELWVYPLAI